MYEEILVPTDESDTAELPVRHRTPRRIRFVARLRSIARELLVPTDRTGREMPDISREIQVQTDNASHHAVSIASECGGRVHFLYVIDSRKYDTSIPSAVEPLEAEGEWVVRQMVDAGERAGVDVVSAVETGRPLRTISAYVDEHDIDLIVMNARDRGGLHLPFLESLPERVSEHTDVDVWTVPNGGSGRR